MFILEIVRELRLAFQDTGLAAKYAPVFEAEGFKSVADLKLIRDGDLKREPFSVRHLHSQINKGNFVLTKNYYKYTAYAI